MSAQLSIGFDLERLDAGLPEEKSCFGMRQICFGHIASHRQRTLLIAKPIRPQGFSAFRFTADRTLVMPTSGFESALDLFMGQIQGKLRADRVASTNFDQIWTEVLAERADPDIASQRELEAVLGYDADEGDADQVRQLLADAHDLGHDAVIEIAADHRPGHRLPTAAQIRSWATDFGRDTRPADIPRITFEALEAFLDGDYSEQAWEEAAQYFKVSARAVWTLLVNNDRLERYAPDADAETSAAA